MPPPRHYSLYLHDETSTLEISGVTGGGEFGRFKSPPPEIPKTVQNRAKLNPIMKNVKNRWI